MSIIPFFSYLSEFREKVSGRYLGQRNLLYGRKTLKNPKTPKPNQTKQQQKPHTPPLPEFKQ